MKQCAAVGDNQGLAEAHFLFHRALFGLADSRLLLEAWSVIARPVRDYLRADTYRTAEPQSMVVDHLALLNLLRRGKPRDIRREFEQHVRDRPRFTAIGLGHPDWPASGGGDDPER